MRISGAQVPEIASLVYYWMERQYKLDGEARYQPDSRLEYKGIP
jgi:hypothetical protein